MKRGTVENMVDALRKRHNDNTLDITRSATAREFIIGHRCKKCGHHKIVRTEDEIMAHGFGAAALDLYAIKCGEDAP